MPDKLTLAAERRTEFGKGYARRIRAAHKIPAVLYGHGTEPLHVALPGHDTMMALKSTNALLTIDLDGEKTLAIARDVQRHAIKPIIVHVDLLIVKKGEKIIVDVPVHIEGESAPGTIHVLEIGSLQVLAEATDLPEVITVSIDGLDDGDKLLAGDITLPKGAELEGDAEQLILLISTPRTLAESDADDAAAADGDADAPAAPAEED